MVYEPDFLEGNTDGAIEFLDEMFSGQRRHLVAISQTGRVEARTFFARESEELREWIDVRQGETPCPWPAGWLVSHYVQNEG
ncbi:hypothetical protein [Rhizobium miluonense]|uniref:Uncharacterized protein n=1 Tax=Rhizobium miluonense TaxID=411945 RepID=A0A1C3XE02_9HYPH|nr:hypothetical protein [Rhizobium miluonense]SCB50502.1 hypothetical protein GA0061102_10911 [Rhizobium miluonense]